MDKDLLKRVVLVTLDTPKEIHAISTRAECAAILDKLYAFLNVLDGKANGMLRIAGVFIGLIGLGGFISVGKTGSGELPPWVKFFLLVSMISFILSTFRCFMIVRMKWHFFEKIDLEDQRYKDLAAGLTGAPPIGVVLEPEIRALVEVAVDRTEHYNSAWRCAVCGFATFFLAFLLLALSEI